MGLPIIRNKHYNLQLMAKGFCPPRDPGCGQQGGGGRGATGATGTPGATGATGATGSSAADAWLLNGNTVGSEKWIGTIDNFNFPIRTNNTLAGTVSNTQLWSIGAAAPVAGTRMLITGTGATSATYSLQIQNSSGTNNSLIVRDDGYVGIGTAAPLSPLTVQASLSGTENYLLTLTNTNNTATEYSGIKLNAPFSPIGGAGFGFVRMGAQSGVGTFDIGSTTNWHDDFYTNNILRMRIQGTTGFVGIGTLTSSPMAMLQVRGSGTTSATNALVIQDSTPTEWFYLRDDHNVGIGTNTYGTSAVNVLGIFNGTVPSTSPADMIQIFSVDISAGNASLGLRTEQTVSAVTIEVPTNFLLIKINGTTYKMLLST